jgi:hypothetical protein
MKHGKGKWKRGKGKNLNEYDGKYQKDKKHGYGVFVWSNGNIYKGEYKNDERNGHGEMRWADGAMYVGQWSKGMIHGLGRMIFPNGSIKDGVFEENAYKKPVPERTVRCRACLHSHDDGSDCHQYRLDTDNADSPM